MKKIIIVLLVLIVLTVLLVLLLYMVNRVNNGDEFMNTKFSLRSLAFKDREIMPDIYSKTEKGKNLSPSLSWTGAPEGTKSFAIIVEDTNQPFTFIPITHWLIYNIPPDTKELAEGISNSKSLPDNIVEGLNWTGKKGYIGPDPISKKQRTYCFNIYALDTVLKPNPKMKRIKLLKLIENHTLAKARLSGYYSK